jgi:hypothetical protein
MNHDELSKVLAYLCPKCLDVVGLSVKTIHKCNHCKATFPCWQALVALDVGRISKYIEELRHKIRSVKKMQKMYPLVRGSSLIQSTKGRIKKQEKFFTLRDAGHAD